MIQIKRTYEPPACGDGRRILVERLWPRGMKKEAVAADEWMKEVAPSTELRQWFGHQVERWVEFRRRYRKELDANPAAWEPIIDAEGRATVTLLYSAHDVLHNGAVVLRDYLVERRAGPHRRATREGCRSTARTTGMDYEEGTTLESGASLYRALVEGCPDAIVVADREGVIRFWNAGAEATFGHTAAEATGKSLDVIIPEQLRKRHWAGYDAAMARGATEYGTESLKVPALHRSGRRLSIEFRILLLRDGQGAIVGIAAFLRDVTAAWNEQRELRRRLDAFEQRDPV